MKEKKGEKAEAPQVKKIHPWSNHS